MPCTERPTRTRRRLCKGPRRMLVGEKAGAAPLRMSRQYAESVPAENIVRWPVNDISLSDRSGSSALLSACARALHASHALRDGSRAARHHAGGAVPALRHALPAASLERSAHPDQAFQRPCSPRPPHRLNLFRPALQPSMHGRRGRAHPADMRLPCLAKEGFRAHLIVAEDLAGDPGVRNHHHLRAATRARSGAQQQQQQQPPWRHPLQPRSSVRPPGHRAALAAAHGIPVRLH